jgi:MerR family mercuric resistance operon transcriptional regulator
MEMQTTHIAIGELSKRTGVNIETVRYYERIGLMLDPLRTEGGHRVYDDEQVKRLTFIARSRQLGFSLKEIRTLMSLVDRGNYSCDEVNALTVRHLDKVRAKIADLQRLAQTLEEISAKCSGGKAPECPIFDALYDDANLSQRRPLGTLGS